MTNPLKALSALADEQFEIEQTIARLSAEMQQANLDLVDVSQHKIPALMEDADLTTLTTGSGLILTVEKKIHAKKLTNRAALDRLIETGQSGLIKSDVIVAFGKADDAAALELMQSLEAQDFQVKRDEHVNPQTLGKYLREQMAEGEDVDLELFGAFERTVTKITLPKVRK